MSRLEVRSNDGAVLLIERENTPNAWWWDVTLSADGVSGKASRIDAEDRITTPIATFFAELAHDWRGWTGAKSWESIERTLRLTAQHDGLGHVSLRATLRKDTHPDAWSLDLTLKIDAGSLDGIARDATAFATA